MNASWIPILKTESLGIARRPSYQGMIRIFDAVVTRPDPPLNQGETRHLI
jgi:hypothetical protein